METLRSIKEYDNARNEEMIKKKAQWAKEQAEAAATIKEKLNIDAYKTGAEEEETEAKRYLALQQGKEQNRDTDAFEPLPNYGIVGVDNKEKTPEEFLDAKIKRNDLMIQYWNEIASNKLENNFDNYIFFATIIWPQVDPRREYTGCENYKEKIITTFTDDKYLSIKIPNNEENMSYLDKYIEDTDKVVKENNEKEWGDLSRVEQYDNLPIYERVEYQNLNPDEKVESENNFRENVLPTMLKETFEKNIAMCIKPDFNGYKEKFITTIGNIDSMTKELNNLCIQYLKNTNEAAYTPEFILTTENLTMFINNNLSIFLEHFKPDAFEIAMSVARKNELFLDEIFQQTYVEEYINKLFKNGNLLEIIDSQSPTIDEINVIMPGVFMKGGLGVMDVLGQATTKRLEAEDASYKKNYGNAFFNIKIQLRMLFDSFRKEVVSPKINEILEKRTSIINDEASNISSQKTAKMQADIDARNKEKDARNKEKTTKSNALIREKEEYSVKKKDLLTQLNAFKELFLKSPMQLKDVISNLVQIKTFIENLNADFKDFKTTSSIENIINEVKDINNKINTIKSRKNERNPKPIYSLDKTKNKKTEIDNTKNAINLYKEEIEELKNKKSNEDNAPDMSKIRTIIAKIGKDTNTDGSPTSEGLRRLNPNDKSLWKQYTIYNSNKTEIPDKINKIKKTIQTNLEKLDELSGEMIIYQLEERQLETKKLNEEEKSLTGDLDSKRNEIIGIIQQDINGIDALIPEKPEVISDALEDIETLPGVDSETVNLSQDEIENSEEIKAKITSYVEDVLDITLEFVEVTANAIIKKNVIEIFVNIFPEELINNEIYIGRYNTAKQKYTDAITDNTDKRINSDAYKEASESNELTTKIRETKLAAIEAQKKIKAEADAKRLADAAAKAKQREEEAAAKAKQKAEEAAARAKQKAEEATARAKQKEEDEAERTRQQSITALEKKRKEFEAAASKLAAVKGTPAVPPMSAPVGAIRPAAPAGAVRPAAPAGPVRPAPKGPVRPAPKDAVRPAPKDAVIPAPEGAVRPAAQAETIGGGNHKTPRSFRRSIKNNQKQRLHTSIKRFNNYKKNKNTKKNYMAYKSMSMPIGGKRTTRLSRMNSNKKINRRTRRSK